MGVSHYNNLLLRSFLFSLLVLSALAAKCLHLFLHAHSLPWVHFVWYFPTFFIPDTLLWGGSWLCLYQTRGIVGTLGLFLILCIAIITLGAASSQIGFFYVTGSEVQWDTASDVASDAAGLRILLSGLPPVFMTGVIIAAIAWFTAPYISSLANRCVSLFRIFSNSKSKAGHIPLFLSEAPKQQTSSRRWALGFVVFTICARLTRPSVPYDHLSSAIPFSLARIFHTKPKAYTRLDPQPFPLPDILRKQYWKYPQGHFKGWTPGIGNLEELEGLVEEPTWYPAKFPEGFKRWALAAGRFEPENPAPNSTDGQELGLQSPDSIYNTYNPVIDPLRITNLDRDILDPLRQAFTDHDIPIRHIFLVEMESARKDIFPFKNGSHLHENILASHNIQDPAIVNSINAKLAALTPIAQQITGESSGFDGAYLSNILSDVWKDGTPPSLGGINIKGAMTASSLTFKSALAAHCGVNPIPLDFMYENDAEIYQPCIMHILGLFNTFKNESGTTPSTNFLTYPWRTVFTQSITAEYDNQSHLNKKMGFKESIAREQIEVPEAKYYHKMEEINYFGFKEQEVLPYMRDTILSAVENNERLFLTHFTSTTHHPWGLPSDYPKEDYWGKDGLVTSHEDINNYLNAVRFVDSWLGEILDLLNDTGIANETLIVFVGDHGQAFREDARASGTYENGHISNFNIPIVFRHPLLPRLDIAANATPICILPTILDLLVNTNSLNERDSEAASDLIHEYEGQSLLRPYRAMIDGRQAWNFGVINAGGAMLSVASAAVPYRLILPLNSDHTFAFMNDAADPSELRLIEDWTEMALLSKIQQIYGEQAAAWTSDAIKVGRWWVDEIKRIWNFHD